MGYKLRKIDYDAYNIKKHVPRVINYGLITL